MTLVQVPQISQSTREPLKMKSSIGHVLPAVQNGQHYCDCFFQSNVFFTWESTLPTGGKGSVGSVKRTDYMYLHKQEVSTARN